MNLKRLFEYEPSIDVTAAQIGISKWNWTCAYSEDENEAKKVMLDKRFDVLPIISADQLIKEFFITQNWGDYSSLKRLNIQDNLTVYYRISLYDLIRKFKEDKRNFYFLKDHNNILGLVTIANLNCQLVYNYLFFLIADLEKSMNEMLKANISEDRILETFKNSSDEFIRKIPETYDKKKNENLDNDIFQEFYLQTIQYVLNKFGNEFDPKIKQILDFKNDFGTDGLFNKIRNLTMHPIRPILSDRQSILELDKFLTSYLKIKDILQS